MYLLELGTDNVTGEDGNGGGEICDDIVGDGNSTAAGEKVVFFSSCLLSFKRS
tara:strand:- start:92 stop:250 length:159 start_codon:yes stop_codon:yes gene_type:complete